MTTRGAPAGPLPRDLVALQRFATLMDEQFQIPGLGTRIGLDALLGFVPGIGDAGGALLSSWIILGALRHHVPAIHILRMVLNVALDTMVGAVPVLGDIFDILFKENVDNVALILRYRDPTRPPRSAVGIWLAAASIALFLIALFLATLLAVGRVFSWLAG
ncbi:MAG: DUF4112 domain-containing protein [Acidobacteria bacterium]|nr:MAG: DUF4112 domain-containing protein [Acidobacteriota bacterium]